MTVDTRLARLSKITDFDVPDVDALRSGDPPRLPPERSGNAFR